MGKNLNVLFITFLTYTLRAWGGALEITDNEIDHKNFSRIKGNLEYFYRVNSKQIEILNQENFFQNVSNPSKEAQVALENILNNQSSIITQSYKSKPRKLKSDLQWLKKFFNNLYEENQEPELKQEITSILTYTEGLLLILNALWK